MTILQSKFKRHVARSFGSAAQSYDAVAELQRKVGQGLVAQIPTLPSNPVILDLGSGTGYFSRQLASRYGEGRVIALDIAEPMLRKARTGFAGLSIAGDAEALPLREGTVDLVFSNMCFQWCLSPSKLFSEIRRVLKPHGKVIFSTFGPETLSEFRGAWATVDGYSHVIDFCSIVEIEGAMQNAGLTWSDQIVWQERCAYPDVLSLMRELKGLGARNASIDRSRALTGKGRLAAMIAAYHSASEGGGGGIVATFEILAGQLQCAGGEAG